MVLKSEISNIDKQIRSLKKKKQHLINKSKCKHTNTYTKFDLNSFPYGENLKLEKCCNCEEIIKIYYI